MGDEKVPADGPRKEDKPPTIAKPPTPTQDVAPGRASEKKPVDSGEKKPAAGAVPQPTTPPKQAAEQASQLQQTVGNQETNRLMRAARDTPGTPALPVSHPDDKSEKEAEAVAKKVTEEHPPHPRDHPAPAHGDPTAIHGDPHEVTGDPAHSRGTVHRAVRHPGQQHHPAPHAPPAKGHTKGADLTSPTAVLNNPGPGEKIPQPTRGILERKLNVDLSHVVIHHDAKADAAVRALHARAVTRGNHIWLASDASPQDLNLMAHEVAHVLQHDNHVVRRAPANPGQVDLAAPGGQPKLTINSFAVPNIKLAWTQKGAADGKLITRVGEGRSTRQLTVWNQSVRDGAKARVDERVKKPDVKPMVVDGKTVYYFALKKAADLYVFGEQSAIAKDVMRPYWDKAGTPTTFQIDHKLEYQLGGDDTYPADNLWLLEAAANGSSGSTIKANINEAVDDVLKAERKKGKAVAGSPEEARDKYIVQILAVKGGLRISGRPDANWDVTQVATEGKPLDALVPMTAEKIEKAGLRGSPKELVIFLSGTGRGIRRVKWDGTPTKTFTPRDNDFFYRTPFQLTKIYWERGKTGRIYGHGFSKKENRFINSVELDFPIQPRAGIEFGGELSEEGVLLGISKKLTARGFSPLAFDEARIVEGRGIVAQGKLLPTVPLFAKLDIDVVLDGDELRLERRFTANELPVPRPFKVNRSNLTVLAGNKGLGVRGDVDFEIERAAHGKISGRVGAGGFELTGQLAFDKKLFEQAELDFFYRKKGEDYQWGLGGALTIGPKQVPGVKKATIKARYEQEQFAASGEADLAVPGLEKGTLNVAYSEKEGFELGGAFQLSKDIPGIKGGEVAATISKKPPANQWKLAAHGTAQPKIPGVDATLTASYEDGVFVIEGQAAYAKGILSGELHVGVTNKPLNPQGNPGEGKPGPNAPLRVYGGGKVTAKFTPWLQGTIGIRLKPEGGVKLTGEVGLPDSINVFDAKEINKNILNIGVDIPIIGVAVAGQRVGIFATVQGGLEASAGVGPGQLRELGLKVDYDLDHEESLAITGKAKLVVPAHAGLRLYIRGGVGVGIPLVSAEAGLEVGGQLGLEGAAEASVEVNWSRAKGLRLDAKAEIHAEPKLKFDISAFVKVEAGIGFLSATLYENKWQLAAKEYGSGLRIGVRAPVHYEEGKAFDFKAEDVQFDVPKIDPAALIGGLVKEITGG